MFRYPTYILFENKLYMDKVSVYYLDPLYFRCDSLKKSMLCYEIIKMWPLPSLLIDRIQEHILNFTQQ